MEDVVVQWWPILLAAAGQFVFLGTQLEVLRQSRKDLARIEAAQKQHHDDDKEEFEAVRNEQRAMSDKIHEVREWLVALDPQGARTRRVRAR